MKFEDFVEEFKTYVNDSRETFLIAEEESEKVLKTKLEKNIDFRQKIEERLETRLEKHNETIDKSNMVYDEKLRKVTDIHENKLQQIIDSKEKNYQSIQSNLEKEKLKLEKTLHSQEVKYLKDEKKCLSTIEKLEKKAYSYNAENLIHKTEKDAQNRVKEITAALEKSLEIKLDYRDQVLQVINDLKRNQAAFEVLETESTSRVQKLKQRFMQEDLSYESKKANLEQTKLRDELKAIYDLDKVIINYQYNITNEALKTEERKLELEFKIKNDLEELRYYETVQELKRDRLYQLEKEQLALETIHQKDRADNVKNNFALSNKQHKNLFIFEKSVHNSISSRESMSYKLTIEEIDIRTKNLIERFKLSISELKTSLDQISTKIKSNLKTELKMPMEQVKLFESKFKSDEKELTKEYNIKIRDIKGKLVLLDQTFDSDEIKELNVILQDVESKYIKDSKELKEDSERIITAYQNKIDFANDRANKIIVDANSLYEKQLNLYNNEMNLIKENSEQEKRNAKNLLESIKSVNDANLEYLKELNDLAITQNDDISKYLVDLSQSNIDAAQKDNELRDSLILSRFEQRIHVKRDWLSNNEIVYNKSIADLDNKLRDYTNLNNKKLEVEKKDLQRRLQRLNTELKSNLNKLNKEQRKVSKQFEKALKDAELIFSKENKDLLDEQTRLLSVLDLIKQEQNLEISKKAYDIFYSE